MKRIFQYFVIATENTPRYYSMTSLLHDSIYVKDYKNEIR